MVVAGFNDNRYHLEVLQCPNYGYYVIGGDGAHSNVVTVRSVTIRIQIFYAFTYFFQESMRVKIVDDLISRDYTERSFWCI